MSPAADLAKQAQKHVESKEYEQAIELLEKALQEIPTSIDYYIKRFFFLINFTLLIS